MPKKQNLCSVLDASIDWFTVTIDSPLKLRFAEVKARQLFTQAASEGQESAFTNRLGFIGDRIEGFFCGKRGDTLLVIGTSSMAAKQAPFFLNLADKVTRLDVAVTLQDEDIDRDWTKLAYQQCSMDGRVDSGLLTTHRIVGTPNGATLYIGSRSSDRFIRIYDKSAQSKDPWPARSWRWEIEYKHPRAGIVAERLARAGYDSPATLDVCRSALSDLRITLPCGGISSGWIATRPHRMTTEETRLAYTTRVIAPFLTRLIDSVGEERVVEAFDRFIPSKRGAHSILPRRRDAP